jgi:hypothetical protein
MGGLLWRAGGARIPHEGSMFAFFKRRKLRRREILRAQAFPAEWRLTLVNKFPPDKR